MNMKPRLILRPKIINFLPKRYFTLIIRCRLEQCLRETLEDFSPGFQLQLYNQRAK
jgi:hypothetical protein